MPSYISVDCPNPRCNVHYYLLIDDEDSQERIKIKCEECNIDITLPITTFQTRIDMATEMFPRDYVLSNNDDVIFIRTAQGDPILVFRAGRGGKNINFFTSEYSRGEERLSLFKFGRYYVFPILGVDIAAVSEINPETKKTEITTHAIDHEQTRKGSHLSLAIAGDRHSSQQVKLHRYCHNVLLEGFCFNLSIVSYLSILKREYPNMSSMDTRAHPDFMYVVPHPYMSKEINDYKYTHIIGTSVSGFNGLLCFLQGRPLIRDAFSGFNRSMGENLIHVHANTTSPKSARTTKCEASVLMVPSLGYRLKDINFDVRDRLLVSLACFKALFDLHHVSIIHRNINLDNCFVDRIMRPDGAGYYYRAYFIDYGYSNLFQSWSGPGSMHIFLQPNRYYQKASQLLRIDYPYNLDFPLGQSSIDAYFFEFTALFHMLLVEFSRIDMQDDSREYYRHADGNSLFINELWQNAGNYFFPSVAERYGVKEFSNPECIKRMQDLIHRLTLSVDKTCQDYLFLGKTLEGLF